LGFSSRVSPVILLPMRAKAHGTVGMIAGGAIAAIPFLVESIPIPPETGGLLGQVGVGCFFGAAGSLLPDGIESSKRLGPNHRGFFHSKAILVALGLFGFGLYQGRFAIPPASMWGFVLPLIAGYLSHLVTDWPSKKGLPLLFRPTARR